MSNSQINLSWADNATNETGFKIERKIGAGGTYSQIGTVGAGVTSYQDTGLAASTQYYYRVRASNGVGDSSCSNEANATTQTPTPPAVPSGLGASAVSSSQINLSWTDNATNETGFKIERKTGSGGTYGQIGTVGANVTAYQDTGLAGSTQYYYRVRATNGGGDSVYSNEANATTQTPLPPAAPSALAASAVSTNQINLSWTDNAADETGFKIERKTGAGGTYSQIATVATNVTTYHDIGLAASTQYYYRVLATNSVGDSAYSNEANATTQAPPPPPAAPSGLAASAISSSQINLSWTDNATSETGFKLERKTGAGGTYAQIATFGANVTTYQDGGLAASTEYYYRVQDSGIGGDSAYSNEANATTQDPPPGPVTIFASMVPAVTNCNTANAGGMEVGTRWQSSQAGTLVGLRYYRSGSDTEQHTLKLWDPAVSTNAPQATVSTVGDSGAGWKEWNLGTPYAIVANHQYVVTYDVRYTNSATYYAYTTSLLATSISNSPPYTVVGNNGCYAYSSGTNTALGKYPTLTRNSTCYFADVMFQPDVAAPVFSPVAGSYSEPQMVTISTTTSGATIRYTTDGSVPSQTVGTGYSAPVNISSNTSLRAIAYKSGMTDSAVASGDYVIQASVAAPAFNPAAGTYPGPQLVVVSSATGGAAIRYTTDGSDPSEAAGALYSAPVLLSSNTTLKAIAYLSGMGDSTITGGGYVIAPPVLRVGLTNGYFQAATTVGQGVTCEWQVSSNLTSWTSVGTNTTSVAGEVVWQENPGSQTGPRFYRVTYR